MFLELSLCVNSQESEYPPVKTPTNPNTPKLMNPETFASPEKSPLVYIQS